MRWVVAVHLVAVIGWMAKVPGALDHLSFRVMNEVPTLQMGAVVAVILRPFAR